MTNILRLLYYLSLPIIFAFVIYKVIHDKKASLKNYLIKDLDNNSLEYLYSKQCPKEHSSNIEKIPTVAAMNKRRFGLGVLAGGWAPMTDSTYKIVREVGFKDQGDHVYTALAAME